MNLVNPPIIDTHIHIWDFEKADYPWLKNNTTILNRTYAIDELETAGKSAGIALGILVQAANNLEDTRWMLHTAASTNWIAGVIGWLPLLQPEALGKEIIAAKQNQYFKGVRHLIHDEADSRWLLQPPVLESLALLADSDLPYDVVGIREDHLTAAITVAEKLPQLQLMLDHLNQPPPTGTPEWKAWCNGMKRAAEHPNMYAKISGLGTAAGKGKNWNADDIKPAIAFVLEHFGPERCCCGGDWPVSLLAGDYAYTWQQYKMALTTLNGIGTLENVFFTTAKKFYKL